MGIRPHRVHAAVAGARCNSSSPTALFVAGGSDEPDLRINRILPGRGKAGKQLPMMIVNSIERHVVLVAPEVHWNTGNIGRTCLGAGALLHLVRPLGFSLEDRQVKRAGLDYWPKVQLRLWNDFDHFFSVMQPGASEMALLTKTGIHPHWHMPRSMRRFLVFGSETKGLPMDMLERFAEHTYRIPINEGIRSLNLSTAVGIALYESLRPHSDDPLNMK